jgi:hypothetical protein
MALPNDENAVLDDLTEALSLLQAVFELAGVEKERVEALISAAIKVIRGRHQ